MERRKAQPLSARLAAEALQRLREHALALRESSGPVPHAALLSLAADAPEESRVTVDFAAAPALGVPVVIVQCPPDAPAGDPMPGLTARERAVAALIAEGLANKQIAARLGITLLTVKDHVHRILVKTGLTNRAAIAAAWSSSPPCRPSGG